MAHRFDGVGFDLDGTLYPNYRLYSRLLPFAFKEFPFLLAMGRARLRLRRRPESGAPAGEDFYRRQAALMAACLGTAGEDVEEVEKKMERLVYRGWEPFFTKIRLFPQVRETLLALKAAGLKLAVLSDFPPEAKLANLGLSGLWDAVLCSEVLGRLKPHPEPFRALAAGLTLPPERVLYVGNSVAYDVRGAKAAGMGAALIRPAFFSLFKKKNGGADLVFSGYRQLRDFVIDWKDG